MIPRKTRLLIHTVAQDHAQLCKIIKLPDYQAHREVEIMSTGICIGSGVRPDPRARKFVSLIADRYAPISKLKLIVPGEN